MTLFHRFHRDPDRCTKHGCRDAGPYDGRRCADHREGGSEIGFWYRVYSVVLVGVAVGITLVLADPSWLEGIGAILLASFIALVASQILGRDVGLYRRLRRGLCVDHREVTR